MSETQVTRARGADAETLAHAAIAETRAHGAAVGRADSPPPGIGAGDGERSPAEIYDQYFVPALFRQWGPVVADVAQLAPGQRVLDVACGTGALTADVCERVGPTGAVVGLDANPQMLEVARGKGLNVDWRDGSAEALPFDDGSFDTVVSQFGLMFFTDRCTALREMRRVLRPGSRLAVAVCDGLERSPGYLALAELLQRMFGQSVADSFRAPFVLGDTERLQSLCNEAGLDHATVSRHAGSVRFDSIAALVGTERACVWTLGGLLDADQFTRLLTEAQTALQPFENAEGHVVFELPALIIAWTHDDH